MRDINFNSFAAFGASVLIAQGLSLFPEVVSWCISATGMISTAGFMSKFDKIKVNYVPVEDESGREIMISRRSAQRNNVFLMIILSSACAFTPLVAFANITSPMIVPSAMVLTLSTFMASTLYAILRPMPDLRFWVAPLIGSVIVSICLQLGAVVAFLIHGPNAFSEIAFTSHPYVAITITSILQALTTKQVIFNYQKGSIDPLGVTVGQFIALKNLFINILQILSKKKK